jgi:hypothetical protein
MPQLPEGATTIGVITTGEPGRVVMVDPSGNETDASRRGWDHFS